MNELEKALEERILYGSGQEEPVGLLMRRILKNSSYGLSGAQVQPNWKERNQLEDADMRTMYPNIEKILKEGK